MTDNTNNTISYLVFSFKIFLENRFKNAQEGDQTFITVDCTDCSIEEPHPFCHVYFSHKYRGPAYKYEVAVSICGGDIVWVSGPWPGAIPDKEIFSFHLAKYLGDDEKAEADNGYRNTDKAVTPEVAQTYQRKKQKSQARGRQENFNGRFKVFDCLKTRYRHHDPHKHYLMFNSIAILVQLSQDHGERMYEIEMDGNYL